MITAEFVLEGNRISLSASNLAQLSTYMYVCGAALQDLVVFLLIDELKVLGSY